MKNITFTTRFFDWKQEDFIEYLKTLTPKNNGIWKEYRVVPSLQEADYIVCWENAPAGFFDNPGAKGKHVFWYPEEPTVIRDMTRYEPYLLSSPFVHSILPNSFLHIPGFFNFWTIYKRTGTFTFLREFPLLKRKVGQLVAITSGDRNTPGQIQRVEFIKAFCQKYPDTIRVYGRRWDGSQGPNGKRADASELNGCYQGEIRGAPGPFSDWVNTDGKYNIYGHYHYALTLENAQQESWVTEKIVDAMLAWCFPFYWGCLNIKKLLPPHSLEQIDIADLSTIDRIVSKIRSIPSKVELDSLGEARRQLMGKYHPLEIITSAITEICKREGI